jgi:hypothetical protein
MVFPVHLDVNCRAKMTPEFLRNSVRPNETGEHGKRNNFAKRSKKKKTK